MKYDKSKCQSSHELFKGYTGCMCNYCEEFKNQPSRWKVNVKGRRFQGEIAIVRKNNRHGFASYGWDHPKHKVILYTDYHGMVGGFPTKELQQIAWLGLIDMAHTLCNMMNETEGYK